MGADWWNVVSLLTGLLAWGLPIVGLINLKKFSQKRVFWVVFVSLSACGVAIFGQLAWQTHLVNIQDYSAMADTSQASLTLSAVLLVVTILLNAIIGFKLYR